MYKAVHMMVYIKWTISWSHLEIKTYTSQQEAQRFDQYKSKSKLLNQTPNPAHNSSHIHCDICLSNKKQLITDRGESEKVKAIETDHGGES